MAMDYQEWLDYLAHHRTDHNQLHASVNEVAGWLGLSPQRVRYHISTGELRAYRPGSKNYRITLESVAAYLIKHDYPPPPAE